MSCLSRSSQAVHLITSRINQINRIVNTTQTSNNQTFTIYIAIFISKSIYGKINGALYPIFFQCGEYNVKSELFIVKHYYSKI